MRDLTLLGAYRDVLHEIAAYGAIGDSGCGSFTVPSPIDRAPMRVIASSGEGWDHVSVSRKNRCPNWPEMEHVKRLFFRDDETAMQLHVPPSQHISFHPHCLHLWRPNDGQEIPRPPSIMVAPEEAA
jgi:hypothetical protein